MRKGVILLLAALALPAWALADSVPSGWTSTGDCGTSGANGVVPLSPTGNSDYEWVEGTTSHGGREKIQIKGWNQKPWYRYRLSSACPSCR